MSSLERKNTLVKVRNEREYKLVMKTIESLLTKATKADGFHHLATEGAQMLGNLSKLAETYENGALQRVRIKPKSLKQKLAIGAPKLSQILTGKRAPDVAFLKAVHNELYMLIFC